MIQHHSLVTITQAKCTIIPSQGLAKRTFIGLYLPRSGVRQSNLSQTKICITSPSVLTTALAGTNHDHFSRFNKNWTLQGFPFGYLRQQLIKVTQKTPSSKQSIISTFTQRYKACRTNLYNKTEFYVHNPFPKRNLSSHSSGGSGLFPAWSWEKEPALLAACSLLHV